MMRPPPRSPLFPYTTLFRSKKIFTTSSIVAGRLKDSVGLDAEVLAPPPAPLAFHCDAYENFVLSVNRLDRAKRDRKSTRLNSSHPSTSYAVFCLKKKKKY